MEVAPQRLRVAGAMEGVVVDGVQQGRWWKTSSSSMAWMRRLGSFLGKGGSNKNGGRELPLDRLFGAVWGCSGVEGPTILWWKIQCLQETN